MYEIRIGTHRCVSGLFVRDHFVCQHETEQELGIEICHSIPHIIYYEIYNTRIILYPYSEGIQFLWRLALFLGISLLLLGFAFGFTRI